MFGHQMGGSIEVRRSRAKLADIDPLVTERHGTPDVINAAFTAAADAEHVFSFQLHVPMGRQMWLWMDTIYRSFGAGGRAQTGRKGGDRALLGLSSWRA